MIRILLVFVFLAIVFRFAIKTVRQMTGKEKWALTKTASYAILCSLLAVATMTLIVVIF